MSIETPPKKSLNAVVKQIGSWTAISRVAGFVRDLVFAHFLGAGAAADAFLVAFKLPNLFRRLTAEGALTNVFLPVYSAMRAEKGEARALVFVSEVQTALLLGLTVFVLLLEYFLPFIMIGLAPGFADTPERLEAAIALGVITLPYLPMISLVALWAALSNAHDDFTGGAAAPVILNLCLIGAAIMIPVYQEVSGETGLLIVMPLAVGVLLAGIGQMSLLQIRMRKQRINPGLFSFRLSAEARRMWASFLPAALGAGALQINLLVDTILASLLNIGAISWLYYADRIAQLPLGIIGIALGTALLPRLSALEAAGKRDGVATEISNSFKTACLFILPAAAALIVIAEPLLSGLFLSGAFTQNDAYLSSLALIAYGVGLPAFVGTKILQPAFYAAGQAKLVLKISLVSVLINLCLSLLLMQSLGHAGLALATSLSFWIVFIWQAAMLRRQKKLDFTAGLFMAKALTASLVMAAGLIAIQMHLNIWLSFSEVLGPRLQLGLLVVSGLILYGVSAVVLKIAPKLR